MSEPISVVVLAKNNSKILPDLLASLKPFACDPGDEIVVIDTGSTDDTAAVCEAAGCKVYLHPELCVSGMHDLVRKYLPDDADKLSGDTQFKDGFLADFAAARTIGNSHAANDLILWIDTDDILHDAANLRSFCREFFSKPEHTCLFLQYDYSFDEDGACNTVLWRERIVRKSLYKWLGVCHESLVPASGQPTVIHKTDAGKIIHKHGRHHTFSDVRNYAILRNAYDTAAAASAWLDPRWDFYIGNACRGLSRWDEAVTWYTRVLSRSGSREDRLAACLNIAYTNILFGRHWRSIDWFFQALKIHPEEPRAYYGIARAYFELKQWNRCLLWTSLGKSLGLPPQLTSVDPNAFDYYPDVFAALSLKELGQVQEALAACQSAASRRPDHPATIELVNDIRGWAQHEQIKRTIQAATSLAFSNEGALDIIQTVRPEIRKHIPELQIEQYCAEPKKCITFLCGTTFEPWDPTSCETGIGGSEKMVILLAREFSKAGYRVEVYGNPKSQNRYKSFDGVTYRPAQSFNPLLERDILIIWRNWGALDLPIRARRIYVDLHDVQNQADYQESRLQKVTGVFFKSQFHLDPVRHLLLGKEVVTRNAIDPAHFTGPAPARDLKKILYTSSADRGLKRALRIFARVKAVDPAASLDVYYGFTPLYYRRAADVDYAYFDDEGCERSMLDYAEECHDLGQQLGVRFVGRVGHQQIATALRSASAVFYPTGFPEISCMGAMEAQAAGCLPICTDTGALKETVKNGVLLPQKATDDAFVTQLCALLQKGSDLDTYRADMSKEALASFNLPDLAASWLAHFERK